MKILILVLLLTGCASVAPVVTRTEYVVKAPPEAMYQIDPPVVSADLTTQRGIAEFIVLSERRMTQCVESLNSIKLYFK